MVDLRVLPNGGAKNVPHAESHPREAASSDSHRRDPDPVHELGSRVLADEDDVVSRRGQRRTLLGRDASVDRRMHGTEVRDFAFHAVAGIRTARR